MNANKMNILKKRCAYSQKFEDQEGREQNYGLPKWDKTVMTEVQK